MDAPTRSQPHHSTSNHDRHHRTDRRRSRSPHRHHHHHRSHTHHEHTHDVSKKRKRTPLPASTTPLIILPYAEKPLSKHDLPTYRCLFARYLDIQKQKNFDDLSEVEVKGRWKRFVEHWNRGELAQGWYDPDTRRRADEDGAGEGAELGGGGDSRQEADRRGAGLEHEDENEDDEQDDFGPRPAARSTNHKISARPPTLDDLALRDEESASAAQKSLTAHLAANAAHQTQRLADILPEKPDLGSKAALLERKRSNAATQAAFRAAKPQAGEMQDVGDAEMGFDDGDSGVKKMRMVQEKRKSEREVRKEEVRLARKVEWEERMERVREREEASMEGLRRLARERFG